LGHDPVRSVWPPFSAKDSTAHICHLKAERLRLYDQVFALHDVSARKIPQKLPYYSAIIPGYHRTSSTSSGLVLNRLRSEEYAACLAAMPRSNPRHPHWPHTLNPTQPFRLQDRPSVDPTRETPEPARCQLHPSTTTAQKPLSFHSGAPPWKGGITLFIRHNTTSSFGESSPS